MATAVTGALRRIYCRQAAAVALTRWQALGCAVGKVGEVGGASTLRHMLRIIAGGLPVPSNPFAGQASGADEACAGAASTNGDQLAPSPPSSTPTATRRSFGLPRHPQMPSLLPVPSEGDSEPPSTPDGAGAGAGRAQSPARQVADSPPRDRGSGAAGSPWSAGGGRDPLLLLQSVEVTSFKHKSSSTTLPPSNAVAAVVGPFIQAELQHPSAAPVDAKDSAVVLVYAECVGQIVRAISQDDGSGAADRRTGQQADPAPSSTVRIRGRISSASSAGVDAGTAADGSTPAPAPTRLASSTEAPNLLLACCLLDVLISHASGGEYAPAAVRAATDGAVAATAPSPALVHSALARLRAVVFSAGTIRLVLLAIRSPRVHGSLLVALVRLLTRLLQQPHLFPPASPPPDLAALCEIEGALVHEVAEQRDTIYRGKRLVHTLFLQQLAELLATALSAAHEFQARLFRRAAGGVAVPLLLHERAQMRHGATTLPEGGSGASEVALDASDDSAAAAGRGGGAVEPETDDAGTVHTDGDEARTAAAAVARVASHTSTGAVLLHSAGNRGKFLGTSDTVKHLAEVLWFVEAAAGKVPPPLYRMRLVRGEVSSVLMPPSVSTRRCLRWLRRGEGG